MFLLNNAFFLFSYYEVHNGNKKESTKIIFANISSKSETSKFYFDQYLSNFRLKIERNALSLSLFTFY